MTHSTQISILHFAVAFSGHLRMCVDDGIKLASLRKVGVGDVPKTEIRDRIGDVLYKKETDTPYVAVD